jgi:hypothetical protein
MISKTFSLILVLLFTAGSSPIAKSQTSHEKTLPLFSLPKVGTVFVNTYYATDSSGALVPKSVADPEMGDDTQIVVHAGIRAHGKSNCTATTGPAHQDTNYISYAKNGNVWIINTNHPQKWTYLPFGLKPGKILKTSDVSDTGTVMGRHYDMVDHDETQVLGRDTVTADGKTYDCIKLQIVHYFEYEDNQYANAETFWYAPAIGYFPRISTGWNVRYFLNQQVKVYRPMSPTAP